MFNDTTGTVSRYDEKKKTYAILCDYDGTLK